jgi:hypothetical protein
MEQGNIILNEVSHSEVQKIITSPWYADFRPKTNAVTLLDMGHTVREERVQEEYGKGRKPNTSMWFMCSL